MPDKKREEIKSTFFPKSITEFITYALSTSSAGFMSLFNKFSIAIKVPLIAVGQVPQAPW